MAEIVFSSKSGRDMATCCFSGGEVDALASYGIGVAGDAGIRVGGIGGIGGEEKII